MLLSLHIPKTAGTSFRMALQDRLNDSMLLTYRGLVTAGSDVVCRFHGRLLEELAPEAATALVEWCDTRDVRCIHGHFSLYALHDLFDAPRCITFVREPVSRLVSAYNHMWVTMPDRAANTSFQQFVRFPRTQNVYETLGMVEYLESIEFVGVTEQYARSLTLLGHKFPELDGLAVAEANVSTEKRFTRDDIPPGFFEELYHLNEADFEIYETVLAWFEEQCAAAGL